MTMTRRAFLAGSVAAAAAGAVASSRAATTKPTVTVYKSPT